MSDRSKIEWTDATWNPVTGCTKVSPGCAYCYAEKITERRGEDFSKVMLHPERLEQPLHWRKPRMVFTCSMADLFHDDVPDWFIMEVFQVMASARQHTFQVLTKRPQRMVAWMMGCSVPFPVPHLFPAWPLPNVWLGVSVENQRWAAERILHLLDVPARVRFLSCEPLLGPLNLRTWLPHLQWVIVGGESGGPVLRRLVKPCICRASEPTNRHEPGSDARWPGASICQDCNGTGWEPKAAALSWVQSIRIQCQESCAPFFFKQWGGPRPTSGGRLLDGRTWNEMPRREIISAALVPAATSR